MKLKMVRLRNFRAYKDTVSIPIDELTAFIGKNDMGKSTVLEAFEIFFNGESKNALVSCDKSDLCTLKQRNQIDFADMINDARTYLGAANYVMHYGEKPMNITWKLDRPIPAKYLKKTSKLVVG